MKCVAYFSDVVAMPADSPNSVSFAVASASSEVYTRMTLATGPKISSLLMRMAATDSLKSAGLM